MRIAFALHTLNPAAGGIASFVADMARSLAERGHTVSIISFDPPDAHYLASLPRSVEVKPLGISGLYGYDSNLNARMENFSCDILILNGLWLYSTYGMACWARKKKIPCVLFPHGMLDPYFKKFPFKHLKKQLYWLLFEQHTVRHAQALCYTTQSELELAQKTFFPFCPRRQEVVSPGTQSFQGDISQAKENFLSSFPALKDKKFLLYLGRIHQKKGLDMLADALRDFPEINLVIAGPIDDSAFYKKALQNAPSSKVFPLGLLTGEMKWGALASAQALVLPSHQENFAMVVPEALSASTPALISNKVALAPEITSACAGLVADDTLAGTRELLKGFSKLSEDDYLKMRSSAKELYSSRFTPQAAAARLETLLLSTQL